MTITVKIKASQQWKTHRNCHIGISLKNPNLTGEPFRAIINWINAQSFDDVFIDLSDTLHRHNLIQDGTDEAQAFRTAHAMGDAWLRENEHTIQNLRVPFRLYRWSHWLAFDDVIHAHEAFKRLFKSHPQFRDAVCRDASGFAVRQNKPVTYEHLANGVRYMLEELAVLSYYFQDYPCAKFYPGKEPACFRMVRTGQISDSIPQTLRHALYTPLWLHRESSPVAVPPPQASAATIQQAA